MKTNTTIAAPAAPNHTTTACIFTPADRKRLKPLLSKDSFEQLMELAEADPFPDSLIDSDGQEIDQFSMDRICINSWHDDGYEYIYQIGKSVYAYDDHESYLTYAETHVTSVIEMGYPYESGYFEEKCVAFDIKPPLNVLRRDHDGSCSVWIDTFYSDSQSAYPDCSRWARDEECKIIEFESYSAARKWINEDKKRHHGYADIQYTKGHYLYRNNEISPRQYKICKAAYLF